MLSNTKAMFSNAKHEVKLKKSQLWVKDMRKRTVILASKATAPQATSNQKENLKVQYAQPCHQYINQTLLLS